MRISLDAYCAPDAYCVPTVSWHEGLMPSGRLHKLTQGYPETLGGYAQRHRQLPDCRSFMNTAVEPRR
jgi:hypothetical protein